MLSYDLAFFCCNIISVIITPYNALNVKLSNLLLNRLKSAIKNGTEVTLKLSSNAVGDTNDENDFPCKLLLTNA